MTFCESVENAGFSVVPGVLSTECTRRLLKKISELRPSRSRAGIRHALQLAPIAEIAHLPLVAGLARELLGSKAFPFHATLFEKSSQSKWLVVWHQDTALPLRQRVERSGWGPWSVKEGVVYAHAPADALSQVLALRVHLDDSVTQNGPLRVLPGTHAMGVLSDDTIHELSTQTPPVECLVPTGGVVAMRPLLVHASSKSQSDIPRRVLHIEYAASDSIAAPLELAITS